MSHDEDATTYAAWASELFTGIGTDKKVAAEFLNKTTGETQTVRGMLKKTRHGWSLKVGMTGYYRLFPHPNVTVISVHTVPDSQAPNGLEPEDDPDGTAVASSVPSGEKATE